MTMRAPENYEVDTDYDYKPCPACYDKSFVRIRPETGAFAIVSPIKNEQRKARWHCLFCKFTKLKKSGEDV